MWNVEVPWTFFLPCLWEANTEFLVETLVVIVIIVVDLIIWPTYNCFFGLVSYRLIAICPSKMRMHGIYGRPLVRPTVEYF